MKPLKHTKNLKLVTMSVELTIVNRELVEVSGCKPEEVYEILEETVRMLHRLLYNMGKPVKS